VPSSKHRLTATRVRDLLAVKQVHNDVQLMGENLGRAPIIVHRKSDQRVRIPVQPAWQVLVTGRRTDPDGSYRDGFNKTFLINTQLGNRDAQLEAAKAWAAEQYGLSDWVKTPFGGWTSKAYLDLRLRVLLPAHFDENYGKVKEQEQTEIKRVAEALGDTVGDERMFRVVIHLYSQPEPPLYVLATNEDNARRQVTQLFTRVAGTRILDSIRLYVYDA